MYSSQLSNFQILVVAMPSDMESDLAKSLPDLKEELRSGFSSLKRKLVEENSSDQEIKVNSFIGS